MVPSLPGVSLAWLVAVAGGAVSGGTALSVYRSSALGSAAVSSDLVRPFLGTTLVFTACTICLLPLTLVAPAPAIGSVPLLTLVAIAVPWTAFALRYAGRGAAVTRGRVVVGGLVAASILAVFALQVAGLVATGQGSPITFLVNVLVVGVLTVVLTASGIVVRSTYRHGSTSLSNGVVVVFPIGVLVLGSQTVSLLDLLQVDLLAALTLAIVATAFPLAVSRYDVLTVRPGTGALGERAVVETMNEAFVVVGHGGRIIRTNDRAEHLFGTHIETERLADVLEPVETLRARETVELWTERGRRLFDPRVSTLTDRRGHELGHTVTLLDVTNREIQRQRIQVLNRILRHNIRNELSVIGARAELALDGETADPHLRTILDVADDLERLSADARRIEKLMGDRRTPDEAFALDTVVESVVDGAVGDAAEVEVAVPSVAVTLDRALLSYALRNVVENAVQHNDTASPQVEVRGTETEDGVRIVVADDGPGIPASERAVIEGGVEEPHDHASSLGLWGTNWAVGTLGGDLSFGRSDLGGAAVTIDLPTTATTPGDRLHR